MVTASRAALSWRKRHTQTLAVEAWKIRRDEVLTGIECDFNVVLPARYREFVLCPSNEASQSLMGSDYDLGQLRELQEWARELLEENGNPFRLGNQDFVILMHQGYQFFFIPCDQGDNPPVYYWLEGTHTTPERCNETFAEWLTVTERA